MENTLTKRIMSVLKSSGYTNSIYIDDFSHSEILRVYQKNGYVVDKYLDEFLRVFGDKRLNYETDHKRSFIDFPIRRILKSYPKRMIDEYGESLNLINLIPFAYAYSGEIGLVKDHKNRVYGIDDDIITLHGESLWLAIENILNGIAPVRISGEN